MDLDRLIEQIIEKARAEGKFDNLEGRGRPLRLEENPYEDPDWRVAYRVLKNAGFRPDWLGLDLELREALARARLDLARSRAWRNETLADLEGRTDPAAIEERFRTAEEWNRALARFKQAVDEINKGIFDLNLKVPLEQLQRGKIDLARELAALEAPA